MQNKEIIINDNKEGQSNSIDSYLTMRQEFITKVNAIMVDQKDYHIIQGKKSLAKGGAEKIASIFKWSASFVKDTEALEMLGEIKGLVAFKCTLTKDDKFIGEGRGAASLIKNANDPNKTLKMAQKSAFIDAVLRASGLSDFFTQDLEDMDIKDIGKPKGRPASDKQKDYIRELAIQKGVEGKITETEIQELTSTDASRWIEKLIKMPTNGKSNATAKAEADFIQDLPEDDIPIINE